MLAYGVPAIGFFENKNIYTGSNGIFRFRIAPSDDGLTAAVWQGKFCYEKSDIIEEASFDKSDEGLEAAVDWVLMKQQQIEGGETPEKSEGKN